MFTINLFEIQSKAKGLESGNNMGFSYDSMSKKSDRIIEASKIYLKLGEYEKYCENLVLVDQWEKALAFAPKVSMDYWQSLVNRYAEHLASQDSLDAFGYQIAGGQVDDV